MRLLAALAIATVSCGPPARPRDPLPVKRPVEGVGPVAPPTGPTPTVHKTRAAVEAPHAGAIQVLTATPDASAVLTLDELGGARLWPTLDGTREPRIVELPAARQLALGTHPGGFTAIALDESGGLYIAKLDDSGRTISHTTHGVEPPYVGLVESSLGTIAWRSDQHVLRIDADGAIRDQLGTNPQERIVDIAVAGNRAIATLDHAGKRQLRWLSLEPGLAWGPFIPPPADGELGTTVALSPDHKHIAFTILDKVQQVRIIDTTGKEIATREVGGVTFDVRFADENLLAVGNTQGLTWMVVLSAAPAAPASTQSPAVGRQRELLAAGGGRAILPSNSGIMLMTPAETKYLGYETLSPRNAQPAPDGGLVVSTINGFHLLDTALRMSRTVDMGTKHNPVSTELQWLGGDDWLLETAAKGGTSQLTLYDMRKGLSSVVRDGLSEAHVLAYEPSSRLATLSFGSASEVARFDSKARTLDRVASAASPTPYEQTIFVPLAPKLARGMQLVHVSLRDKPTIKWLADAHALDKPAATLTLDGAYAAADPAGHVYAWRTTGGKHQLVIYTDGKQTGTLPSVGPATLWPSPQGTHVLEIAQAALTMYQVDGKQVWTKPLSGAQEALWLTDGAIAISHATGVVRIDATSAVVTSARCGWGFGLSTKPHPFSSRIEPVCTQLLR